EPGRLLGLLPTQLAAGERLGGARGLRRALGLPPTTPLPHGTLRPLAHQCHILPHTVVARARAPVSAAGVRYRPCLLMYWTTPSGTRYQTGIPACTRCRQSVEDIAMAGTSIS